MGNVDKLHVPRRTGEHLCQIYCQHLTLKGHQTAELQLDLITEEVDIEQTSLIALTHDAMCGLIDNRL